MTMTKMQITKKTKISKERTKRSGGPRTAAGKAKAKMNALTHGLSARVSQDPLFLQQSRKLAVALCGGQDHGSLFEQAMEVAESHQALVRVRQYRMFAIERLFDPTTVALARDNNHRTKMKMTRIMITQEDLATRDYYQLHEQLTGKTLSPIYANKANLKKRSNYEPLLDRDEFQMMKAASRDLDRIARYERRAWSRRKRAIRDFIAMKAYMETSSA
jgi:hypothetical protein